MKTVFFPWRKEYELGIKEIDKQHRSLVDIINELYDAFIENKHKQKLAAIIQELNDYVDVHFSTEEKYFEKFGYSGKDEHIQEHNTFRQKVNEFQKEHSKGKASLTFQILNFLRDWLSEHILGTDQQYKALFHENGL